MRVFIDTNLWVYRLDRPKAGKSPAMPVPALQTLNQPSA
jgi:predicted nucleic acid-binding protein